MRQGGGRLENGNRPEPRVIEASPGSQSPQSEQEQAISVAPTEELGKLLQLNLSDQEIAVMRALGLC